MAVNLSPVGGVAGQFFDNNGNPLSGGKIFTYASGTTTNQATYTSASGGTAHANPIILDSAGRVPSGEIWLTDGLAYKFVIKDSNDVLIGTYDNVIGINSNFVNFTNQQEIQTATAGQTVFNLTTMQYQPATNSLSVFVDGVNQYGPGALYAYVETDSDTVTFTTGLHVGAEVKFTTSNLNSSAGGDAFNVSYTPTFVGAATTNVGEKLEQTVSVKDFGAVGDFNPATGLGTDDRAAIQAALDYAITVSGGCTVIFPSGNYYLGTGYGAYGSEGVQINLGTTSAGSASNINLISEGAILYQGAAGRCFGIFGADKVLISGFTVYGYTGGTLSSARERDSCFSVAYNSKNVTFENNYLTNSLGDCIYLGGSLVNGSLTGLTSENITIQNNVLKERYGNGTPSVSSGTKSRWALAVIDCAGLQVQNNIIYGAIDLEPNANGQYLTDISINNNQFKSGNVTAQSVIGTAYWYDEPINLSGGSVIQQAVYITGIPGSPIVARCVVNSNVFQSGLIADATVYKFDTVFNNFFTEGKIRTGATSGSNYTPNRNISDNYALAPLTGETTFIQLNGEVALSIFKNNRAGGSGFTYCIDDNGASTGDIGRCAYINNTIESGTAVLGLTIASTSTEVGSVKNGPTNTNLSLSSKTETGFLYVPLVTLPTLTGLGNVLSWATYGGNCWFIPQSSGAATSISDVTNEYGDAQELTIMSGAAGGGTLTIVYDVNKIRLNGNVDAVMGNSAVITLISRAGIWFEKSRNF